MRTTFATNDSLPVTISLTDDGEDIRGNVYTFDIGFCTHDCPVFAFTNVDVLKMSSVAEAVQEWSIVSGSGMVLKLVTGSMSFATIDEAFAVEHRLAQALALSMEGSASPVCSAITLEQMCSRWCDPLAPFAVEKRLLCPQSTDTPRFTSWLEVRRQLTEDNLDNRMNMVAALQRYRNNEKDWEQYVGATVVSLAPRDGGYISRVNMPMTLAGYFLYMARVCLPRTDNGFEDAALKERAGSISPEQLVTDWFWSSLLAQACNSYLFRVFGMEALTERGIALDIRDIDPGRMSYNNLRAAALLYLIANKVLSGALASLSDGEESSAGGDSTGKTSKDMIHEDHLRSLEWAEYHTSLMGLTGAWFRAALLEVMRCEEFTASFCRAVAFGLRDDVAISIWHRTLKQQLMTLEDQKWDGLFADRKGVWDDLREHRWKPLVIQIAGVEQEIADELEAFAEWRERCPELSAQEYRSQQRSAEHMANPAWEGRPTTMMASIPHEEMDAWTYMVERQIRQTPRHPEME